MNELIRHGAARLAQMIRQGEVTSRQVVEAHLARIDEVNGSVNAITAVLADTALAAADAADQRQPTGPLHGVPFTTKENIDLVGTPTTNGVPALAQAMPTLDAPVVARMKGAGAIPIGRTNLPEMGLRLSTDNPLRGRTVNPWNPSLTAGGSSGGEAVALATGMTPIGLGNDIGGSLRNPAYCCGTTSLKPTRGRIPHASSIDPQDAGMAVQAMLVEGPMARTVADLELGLQILAGRDPRDPVSVDAPLTGPAPARRVAALVTDLPGGMPAETAAAIERAGEILARAGWAVEIAEPPELGRVTELWGQVLATDFSVLVPMIQPMITAPLHDALSRLVQRFDPGNLPNSAIHSERARFNRLWSAFFADFPVVVGPTWTRLPWLADADLDPATGLDVTLDTVRFITPGNVLGLPSVVLPMGTSDGRPTGVQVYADLWREDLCLEAAAAIEAEAGLVTPIDPQGVSS